MADLTLPLWDEEEWRPIPGYEGLYQVSSLGRVRSLSRLSRNGSRLKGQIISAPLTGNGRRGVGLTRDGKRTSLEVHVLVAMAFLGPRPKGPKGKHVRHLDDDHLNNAAYNLAYGSASDNQFDRVRNGIHHMANRTHCPSNHPYDEANTRWYRGYRHCRACDRERGGPARRALRPKVRKPRTFKNGTN